jgi:hypothetical protein
MSQWQPYPNVPWIQYAPCGCAKGGFFIRNTQTGEEFHTPDENGIHQYAADVSGQRSRVRLGDAVHKVTKAMGMTRCSSCAKRQTFLNRLFGS